MKIGEVEKLFTKLRGEFGKRVDEAEIELKIDPGRPGVNDLRWRFDISDVCVDRLSIWTPPPENSRD